MRKKNAQIKKKIANLPDYNNKYPNSILFTRIVIKLKKLDNFGRQWTKACIFAQQSAKTFMFTKI